MYRRDFIKVGGRMFFLALMLSGAGLLVGKRRVKLGAYCEDNSGCAACQLNTICRDAQRQISVEDGKQSK